jgi:ATP-dependent RNA helicase DeaD
VIGGFDLDLAKSTEPTGETFGEIPLSPVMMQALARADYLTPTPVQAGLIPRALEGEDVVGQARTGTGKTAAFLIPILERLKPRTEVSGPQALILAPTRELAVQVHGELQRLAHGRRVRSVALYGGKPIRGQIEKLRRGVQLVVGTPGRILDHISRQSLCLDDVAFVVLDEADRMLDIGFRPDIEKILRRCPRRRQTFLLSATVPPPIQRLARRYMRDPVTLDFSPEKLSVDTIRQFYFTVDQSRKFDLLTHLLQRENPTQAIVFCRTRRGTERLYQRLKKRSRDVGCIHGDMHQTARDRVMERFRAGRLQVLVATDVVGRGIDVTSISHIINYDIPQFCDDYVHRVGRTGRMGREGVAFTFVTPEEGPELTRIEIRIDSLLQRDEITGFEAAQKEEPAAQSPTSQAAAAAGAKPQAPLLGRRGRPLKRYRRAL